LPQQNFQKFDINIPFIIECALAILIASLVWPEPNILVPHSGIKCWLFKYFGYSSDESQWCAS